MMSWAGSAPAGAAITNVAISFCWGRSSFFNRASRFAGMSPPRSWRGPAAISPAQQFGLLAPVFSPIGALHSTEDIGRIVYTLVEVGLLVTQPGDHESDFKAVYQFTDAFGESYDWQGLRGA